MPTVMFMTRAQARTPAIAASRHDGFTLIELLVVIIVLGVLAAIAVPVFLSQRAKAHDSATKADVSNLGKEVATYWIGNTAPLSLTYSPGTMSLVGAGYSTVARLTVGSAPPSIGASASLDDPQQWCVALTDPAGSQKTFRYSGLNGLEPGTC